MSEVFKPKPFARLIQLCSLIFLAIPSLAAATFSIVACDRTGNCGAAVATNNLAVGASVPYAQARVGALVSQFETNPTYGPKGLALLSAGESPEAVMKVLLDSDDHFDDSTIAARQVGIVDTKGRSSVYSGSEALRATWEGGWQDIDLRVDGAAEPIEDLRRLMEQHYALQAIIRAEHQARNGMNRDARASISDALRRSRGWDRIWRRCAAMSSSGRGGNHVAPTEETLTTAAND
jgi:uncharacterized Ntn-hydrolase superfamily protein